MMKKLLLLCFAAFFTLIPLSAAQAASKQTTLSVPGLGKVLTVNHKTVYTLKPSNVICASQCHKVWPAVEKNHHQLKYHGHRLYFFSGDAPGQVNGYFKDTWGSWTPVIVKKSQTSTATTYATPKY
jgi:hypothetical protein